MTDTTNIPQCWRDVEDALAAGIDRLILFGPPGTGKTYAGLTFGNTSQGAFRVICNEDMTAADVTGHYKPSGNDWKWQDGQVVKAWQGNGLMGGRVVADEIDRASGDVLSLLLAMFDTPDSASWEHPETGVHIRPLPGFSVVMTTNVEDMRELPQALKDRFPVAIRIDQPHPNGLLSLPADLRPAAQASADADRDRRFSLRAFQAFAKLRDQMGVERAAKMIFGSHADSIIDAIKINSISSSEAF
jgi:midasin (ATPase involved in ribosome maturation)